jgi:hypothetical protein
VTVQFAPTTTGTQTGSLIISDTASDSPQVAPITGSGTDFTAPVNSPAIVTLTAGQSGTFTASVMPLDGLTNMVAFACTGAPLGAACLPGTTMLNADGTQSSVVTVTTTARAAVPMRLGVPPSRPLLVFLFGLLLTLAALWASLRMHPSWQVRRFAGALALVFALLEIGLLSACGGSSGGSTSSGTPAGTYTLTVIASVGSQTHSSPVSLVVQ